MMAITKKEKAKAPGGTRRVGSDFKRLMIQSVVWRGNKERPAGRWKCGNYAELREASQI